MTVLIQGDTRFEGDEYFEVVIDQAGGIGVADFVGSVTIEDDDSLPGDTNGDHIVDLIDLNNVRNRFGGPSVLGDTDGDGDVDLDDLNAVRNYFGNSLDEGPSSNRAYSLPAGRTARTPAKPLGSADYGRAADFILGRWMEATAMSAKRRLPIV